MEPYCNCGRPETFQAAGNTALASIKTPCHHHCSMLWTGNTDDVPEAVSADNGFCSKINLEGLMKRMG
jgi:hypothetical protein